MREISVSEITELTARLCEEANLFLPDKMQELIDDMAEKELACLSTLWVGICTRL